MRQAGKIGRGCAVLVLGAAVLGQAALAQDAGQEWQSRTAAQSRIVFPAPGLDDQRVRHMRTVARDNTHTAEVAFWRGDAARHHKALVRYVELSPDRHFRSKRDPKRFIRALPAFQDKDLEIRKLKRDSNLLGTVESRRFGFDDVQCVAFVQYWGQSSGDRASAGTRLLSGYYCANPGQPLTSALRKEVIKSLGIKGKAVPATRTALPLEIWLEKPDRPKGLYFGKLLISQEDEDGDIEFRLPSPYGLCKGRWKSRMGGGETTSSVTFDWSVDCANGQKAAGDYRVIEWERGEGAGRMTDGARLTLESES